MSSPNRPPDQIRLPGDQTGLQAEFKTVGTAIDAFGARLEEKIDAQTVRLTIRLGGILIAGLVGMGLVLCAGIPFLLP
jgi:hypothetical protein